MKKLALTICSLTLYGGLMLQTIPAISAAGTVYTDPNAALKDVGSSTSYQAPLPKIIGNILNAIFGILGIIALILVVWSGFQWMTGGTEGVTKAKDRLKNAAIGLLLILIAYSLTNYIIGLLTLAVVRSSI